MAGILKCKNVTKRFGGLIANKDISFSVDEGSIVGIVGPNGAGKTTLFNSISRAQKISSGSIIFKDQDISNLKAYEACKLGIGRTFQIPKTLTEMTVLDNIVVGALCHDKKIDKAFKLAKEISAFCELSHLNDQQAETLNVMQKKRLEIARALASKPSLLLLDETMAGLNGIERKKAIELILRMNELGITILMIEHVMEVIMSVSHKVVVIASGEKIMEGTPEEVTSHPDVIKAYLGGDTYVIS